MCHGVKTASLGRKLPLCMSGAERRGKYFRRAATMAHSERYRSTRRRIGPNRCNDGFQEWFENLVMRRFFCTRQRFSVFPTAHHYKFKRWDDNDQTVVETPGPVCIARNFLE